MLFVNADDFGLSHEVNMAIVEAFKKGLINNTTIMVNMPGFEEAVRLAEKYGFFDRVGLHLNLFEGKPLTEDIKREVLFYDVEKGELCSYRFLHQMGKKNWFFIPVHTRKALRLEAQAQVEKYINAGFSEMHFDSHGHSHTFFSVYDAVYKVMKRHGFQSSRLSLNIYGHPVSRAKKIYKKFINSKIQKDFRTAEFFCGINDYIDANQIQKDSKYEIMVHPIFSGGVLTNRGSKYHFDKIEEVLRVKSFCDIC